MKPETEEWINKAEGDLAVAHREMQAPDPVWNVISFLAQQCAEKYLKAFLEQNGLPFRKIHDLVLLLDSSGGRLPELDSQKQELARLSTFGIAARYPGVQADRHATEEALKIADNLREVIRIKLGIP
jgi:HEPN domain-containing protein